MMIMPHTYHFPSWCVKDLGELNAPLMICGGVYGNLEAFQALLERADELSIPAENIIHTGDLIACCADPLATIELMVGCSIHAIRGNIENNLVCGSPACGCESGPKAMRDDVMSSPWYKFLDETLEIQYRRHMAKLPHQLTFKCEGKAVRVVHGTVSSINQFIYASDSTDVFQEEFELAQADIIISGHSGIPFTRQFGRRVWHNSGGLGVPANDGTHRGWYSVAMPDETYGLKFKHYSLHYDYEKARDKMKVHELSEDFRKTLRTGLWPSQELLPEYERSCAGKPLDADKLIIVDSEFGSRGQPLQQHAAAL